MTNATRRRPGFWAIGLLAIGLTTPAAAEPLRLLSYNIHHGEGNDGKLDLERVAELIKAQKPDVVFLQEVDKKCRRTGQVDQPAELARLTGMTPVFAKFMDYDGGEYGQCLLTRLEILDSRTVVLPKGVEPRASAVATVKTANGPVVVADVHFYATEKERLAQAEALTKDLSESTAPVILCGDFNSEPGDPVMERLAQSYAIPKKMGDDTRTFPSTKPDIEIDFVLFRPTTAFKATEYRVLNEPVISDHQPVLCILEFEK
jgi:endonuclease/exonuclease/phosphatase family metal-dependent hydrolase